jgi:hypothetical protein
VITLPEFEQRSGVVLSTKTLSIFGVASRSLFPDGPLHQLSIHFSGDGYDIRNGSCIDPCFCGNPIRRYATIVL